MLTWGKVGVHKPNPKYSKGFTTTDATTLILLEAIYYEEAQGVPECEKALRKEYEALIKNIT